VLEDVALIWGNCRAYNADGSDMAAAADAAEAAFARAWQRAGLPDQAPAAPAAEEGAAAEGGGRKRRRLEAAAPVLALEDGEGEPGALMLLSQQLFSFPMSFSGCCCSLHQ
jgi:hypothetical protein